MDKKAIKLFDMPRYWKYLTASFLKTFFLSMSGFVGIILITRMKEIARFIALSSDMRSIILYILYQMPYIIPIALPISCLISSYLLFHKMSNTHELTALRTSGLSITKIMSPLIFISCIFVMINFFIASEWATKSLAKSKETFFDQTSKNPILLLQRQNLSKLKDCDISMTSEKNNKNADDVLFISFNKNNERLNLFSSSNLKIDNNELLGKDISFISYVKTDEPNSYDTLIIENQSSMNTKAENLSKIIKSKKTIMNPYHLPFSQLIQKWKNQNGMVANQRYESIFAEIIRRTTLGLSAFTFTFLGITLGIDISRNKSKKKIIIISFLTLMLLSSFVFGKSLKYYAIAATLTYLLPQLLTIIFSMYTMKKIERGQE